MRVARTQPPVGYQVPLRSIARSVWLAATAPSDRDDQFLPEVQRYFGVKDAFAVSSGKAALTVILRALHALTPGRKKVILPAYTCFSLPSSVVKAGLDVIPCDVAPGSFDFDYAKLAPLLDTGVLCVISVHLFGIPSETKRLQEHCSARGIFVVEDAAQAFGGVSSDGCMGTSGDVGFFSFGRGKNITCGSGGLVVTSDAAVSKALKTVVPALPPDGVGEQVRSFVTLALLRAFISPNLYWFPAGIPYLRLGETIFHEDFSVCQLGAFKTRLLSGWVDTLNVLNSVRREHAQFYIQQIRSVSAYDRNIPYLRFPVLLSQDKESVLDSPRARALGISGMYPTTVDHIPQLSGRLPNAQYPVAERIARSLITLPTHPMLSADDRAEICQLVETAEGVRPATVSQVQVAS